MCITKAVESCLNVVGYKVQFGIVGDVDRDVTLCRPVANELLKTVERHGVVSEQHFVEEELRRLVQHV